VLQRHISRHETKKVTTERKERACDRCHLKKLKCYGEEQCSPCVAKGLECKDERDKHGPAHKASTKSIRIRSGDNEGGTETPGVLAKAGFTTLQDRSLANSNLSSASSGPLPPHEISEDLPRSNHPHHTGGYASFTLPSDSQSLTSLLAEHGSLWDNMPALSTGDENLDIGLLLPDPNSNCRNADDMTNTINVLNQQADFPSDKNLEAFISRLFIFPDQRPQEGGEGANLAQIPIIVNEGKKLPCLIPKSFSSLHLKLYFTHFHHHWPILHASMFDENDDPYVLTASVSMIGAWLEGTTESRKVATTLHDRLMNHVLQRLVEAPAHRYLIYK
jgi:hypothetical protein